MSQYPTPYEDLNLKTISDIEKRFACVSGLSDHSMGSAVDVAAVVLGASIIEKHLTLRRSDGGPDGVFSMEPEEFARMVTDVRNVEKGMGKVTYDLTEKQRLGRKNARSLYVVKEMKKGDVFTEENLKSIRPGRGVPTWFYEDILGKKASLDIAYGTPMSMDFLLKEE